MLTIRFVHFWPDFDTRTSSVVRYFKHALPEAIIVGQEERSDMVVASVFGGDLASLLTSRVRVLYIGEPVEVTHPLWKQYEGYFHLVMGFHQDKHASPPHIRFPIWMFYYDFYEKMKCDFYRRIRENRVPQYDPKRHFATLIARNPLGARMEMLSELQKANIIVHCPSHVGKNMPTIESTGKSKVEFLRDYCINLCPENSTSTGYVTEKLFEAVDATCIPVYWGDPGLEPGIFRDQRILYWEGEKTMATILRLKEHPEQLREFYETTIFTDDATDRIDDILENFTETIRQLGGWTVQNKRSEECSVCS